MTTKNRALFLDRDGVINVDYGHVYRIEDFEFVPGILDLAKHAHNNGYLVIVVTNQAGIGRCLYTEAEFQVLTQWMCQRFRDEGAPLTHVYFCPTHPTEGVGHYLMESEDRKPGPGMLLRAEREYDLDLKQSIFIGDKQSDMQAGLSAGVGTNLFLRSMNNSLVTVRDEIVEIINFAQVILLLHNYKI